MSRKYKFNDDGSVIRPKSRYALRSYLMRPHVHYDPSQIAAHMADRTTARLMLNLAAGLDYQTAHFDITAAFPN